MHNITFFLLILFLINSLYLLHVASANDYLYYICGSSSGNATENSTYQSNLAKLFASLSSETVITEGFSTNNTSGALQDQIFGLVLCRGDVNSSVCGDCLINQSFRDVQTLCPYAKEAIIWYDYCLFRYSNNDFLGSTDNSQRVIMWNNARNETSKRFSGWNPPNAATKSYFKAMMKTLLSSVSYRAAYSSEKRFAIEDINIASSVLVIYSMAQCTPDMSNDSCHACLQDLTDQMLNSFDGREGGRILGVRCSLRYETYNFFSGYRGVLPLHSISSPAISNPLAPSATPLHGSLATPAPSASTPSMSDNRPTSAPPSVTVSSGTNKGGRSKLFIIIINVTAALLLCGFIFGFCWIQKQRYYSEIKISQKERKLKSSGETSNSWSRGRDSDFTFFDFDQIAKATDNFSLGNKLGHGGFGTVYKGVLQDGLEVAVKRLSAQSCQGVVEFQNEIRLIVKLQHRNLVRLLGWCIHGEENLLVYEFMPNKSLDTFIFDKKRREVLKWEKRLEIIEGIAQGLLYLHKHSRLRVVHRDLKASNILLDSEMNPKISDFGLARIFDPKELQAITTRVVGTYGYMAPEYASEGLFSIKSDVFSFGVLILEIVSGKKNTGFHQYGDFLNLVGYAWDRWKEGKSSDLISPTLTEASEKEIERCIQVGLLCVQENPMDRPFISEVISFLTTANIILPEPKPPAYFNIRVSKEAYETLYSDCSSRSVNYITMTNPEGR